MAEFKFKFVASPADLPLTFKGHVPQAALALLGFSQYGPQQARSTQGVQFCVDISPRLILYVFGLLSPDLQSPFYFSKHIVCTYQSSTPMVQQQGSGLHLLSCFSILQGRHCTPHNRVTSSHCLDTCCNSFQV